MPASLLPNPEIGGNHQMRRRMIDPVTCQLFDLKERHRIDYRIAVSAGGGEKAVDASPVVAGVGVVAPKADPGAMSSPDERPPPGLSPEPVSTA